MKHTGLNKKKWSKYTGVVYVPQLNGWKCYTGGGNNKIFGSGHWDTEDEAALARNKMMIARFGYDPNPNNVPEIPFQLKRFVTHAESNRQLVVDLTVIKEAGEGVLYIRSRAGQSSEALRGRLRRMLPLIRSQSYVKTLRFGSGVPFDVDLDESPAVVSALPWLTVEPQRITPVIIHHSGANPASPLWKRFVEMWGNGCLFLGSRIQKQALRAYSGCGEIRTVTASDYLIAAKILAGAGVFVGDESTFSMIARGLGIPVVMENSPEFHALETQFGKATK